MPAVLQDQAVQTLSIKAKALEPCCQTANHKLPSRAMASLRLWAAQAEGVRQGVTHQKGKGTQSKTIACKHPHTCSTGALASSWSHLCPRPHAVGMSS